MSEYANRKDRGRLVGLVFSMQAVGLIVGPLVGLCSCSLGHRPRPDLANPARPRRGAGRRGRLPASQDARVASLPGPRAGRSRAGRPSSCTIFAEGVIDAVRRVAADATRDVMSSRAVPAQPPHAHARARHRGQLVPLRLRLLRQHPVAAEHPEGGGSHTPRLETKLVVDPRHLRRLRPAGLPLGCRARWTASATGDCSSSDSRSWRRASSLLGRVASAHDASWRPSSRSSASATSSSSSDRTRRPSSCRRRSSRSSMRTTGHGIAAGIGKLGAFVGRLPGPAASERHRASRHAARRRGVSAILGFLVTRVLPEPSRQTLEDVSGQAPPDGPAPPPSTLAPAVVPRVPEPTSLTASDPSA